MSFPSQALRIVLVAGLLLAGCASEPPDPRGTLEFSAPPAGLMRARPVAIDGRPIVGSLSRTSFDVDAGFHSITLVPAEGGEFGEDGPPAVRVTVEVRAGVRHHLAMRSAGEGAWEVVAWREDGG